MRKLTLITAAAGTALAFAAAPASAQYRPVQQGYPYAGQYAPQPQGYAYGYNNNYGQVRSMQARLDGIQHQIQHLRARRMINRNEANGLLSESRRIELRLRQTIRYGLNRNEARDIDNRIHRLEHHVSNEVRDGRGRYGYDNRYNNNGYNNGAYGERDRDRDGRDDGYEDDRGTRHDPH